MSTTPVHLVPARIGDGRPGPVARLAIGLTVDVGVGEVA